MSLNLQSSNAGNSLALFGDLELHLAGRLPIQYEVVDEYHMFLGSAINTPCNDFCNYVFKFLCKVFVSRNWVSPISYLSIFSISLFPLH